ncbi:MAG: YihY/virulence factor BrkB family protein [Sedimentisphaerales bacterium]
MLPKIINYLQTDIWRVQLKHCPRKKFFLLRTLRIIVLAVRGFIEDKCKFRASALTFFSILSIVPIIALIFGVAKGFGFEKMVEKELMQKMEGQTEVATKILDFANSLLANVHGGVVAGIGVLFLFWTVINVLSNIENSFNDIWGVKAPRTFARKFSDYISMTLVCPFLLVISGSLTVVISSQIKNIIQSFPIFHFIGPLVLVLLNLLPYVALWVVFTFIFMFMPNTKVKFTSGLLAGIVAGTILQITQLLYIKFQIGAARYGAIYGSFAALPLFLLWLQTSWLIVLFGAEISFAHQNVDTYEFEQECLTASNSFKKLTALLITQLLVKRFCGKEQPLNEIKISQTLEIPIRLVRQVVFELVESGILSEIKTKNDKEVAYQPAIDVDMLTIKYVADAIEQRGNVDIPVEKTPELDKLIACLNTLAGDIEKSPANALLKNI